MSANRAPISLPNPLPTTAIPAKTNERTNERTSGSAVASTLTSNARPPLCSSSSAGAATHGAVALSLRPSSSAKRSAVGASSCSKGFAVTVKERGASASCGSRR